MNAAKARALAIETIAFASAEGQPVAETTVVGINESGYWVTDNGEEVSGLTKDGAIEIIVENLAKPQVAIIRFNDTMSDSMANFPLLDEQYIEYEDATSVRLHLAGRDDTTAAQEQYLNTNPYVVGYEVIDA